MKTKWIVIGIVFAIIILCATWTDGKRIENDADTAKWDTCVSAMQEAYPDPNETEGRSAFLKSCYEADVTISAPQNGE